jgi:glucose-6-phosphate 1-dehydrogenase
MKVNEKNKSTLVAQLTDKISEIEDLIVEMKTDTRLSVNTVSTQTYHKKCEIRTLKLIASLISGGEYDEEAFNKLVQLKRPRKAVVTLKEGDNIFTYLSTNPTHTFNDIVNFLEKSGLKNENGKVVKATA